MGHRHGHKLSRNLQCIPGNYVKYKDFKAGTKTISAMFYGSSVKGIRISSVIVSGERVENVKAAPKEDETWKTGYGGQSSNTKMNKVQIPSATGLMSATDDWTL